MKYCQHEFITLPCQTFIHIYTIINITGMSIHIKVNIAYIIWTNEPISDILDVVNTIFLADPFFSPHQVCNKLGKNNLDFSRKNQNDNRKMVINVLIASIYFSSTRYTKLHLVRKVFPTLTLLREENPILKFMLVQLMYLCSPMVLFVNYLGFITFCFFTLKKEVSFFFSWIIHRMRVEE